MDSDLELFTKAIEASGLSVRRFAWEILGVNDRTARRWIGTGDVPPTVVIISSAIIARPALAKELAVHAIARLEARLKEGV